MTREEEIVKYQLEQHQRNQEIDKETQNMSLQERAGFIAGVDWSDQHPRKGLWDAEKVCNILRNKMDSNWFYEKMERSDYDSIIKDLRKAMEE